MKKLILVAVVAAFSLTAASAQIVSSSSRSLAVVSQEKEKKESSGILYFAYESPAYKYEGNTGDRFNGFAMGYTKNVSLSSSIPFFFNWGVSLNYARYSEKEDSSYEYSENILSFAIPLGISYALPLSDKVSLVPAFGMNMRIGALYNYNLEIDETSEDASGSFYDYYEDSNRFTVGIYTGGSFEFNTVSIGVYYIKDFTPFVEDGGKYSAISLRLGFRL